VPNATYASPIEAATPWLDAHNYLKKKRGRKENPKFCGEVLVEKVRQGSGALAAGLTCLRPTQSRSSPSNQTQHSNWPSCHWPPEAEVPTSLPGLDSDPQLRESGIIDLNSRIPRHHAGPQIRPLSPAHTMIAQRVGTTALRRGMPPFQLPSIGTVQFPSTRQATRTGPTETGS